MNKAVSQEKDTERSQAIVRLIVASLATVYVAVVFFSGNMPASRAYPILLYNPLFLIISVILLALIMHRPGIYPGRRLFAMLHDYSAIGFAMVVGGEVLLPLYGAMLWVTVGNGMRYGTRYLAVATALALVSIAIIAYLTPYWRQQPYILLTLIATTLMVPAYAHVLLTQTRRASEQATAANLAKSRFLAQASHDLRQPIHSISLFTACLRDANLGTEERHMVDNIDRSLHGVEQLFRSILDIYTLDNGQVIPRLEVIALDDVLEQVVRQNAEAARWAAVAVRLRAGRQHVLTDPGLLTTMLQNIVSNALKYARGRPVLIGCRRRAGGLAIEVYDQGTGIAAEHLPNVFDEFYRARQVRDKDVEGVGLGLSIVKRIGELLGLNVRIDSLPGRGTMVAIEGLALARAEDRPPVLAPGQGGRLLTGLRVLLIEDDHSVLLATATLLQKWGCSVQAASAIPPGNVPCDLVVTDFDLDSTASGADCIDYLNRLHGRKVPAVVITGHDVRKVQERLGDPDVAVLAKPIRPAELRSLLLALKLDLQQERGEGSVA